VTGLDLSEYMLGVAEERGHAAGLAIRWVQADMRRPPQGPFDLVLNLFTSFGYFADEPDDRRVATAAATMLDPGGRLLIELINGERVMKNFQEREWFTVGDAAVMERRWLDRGSRRMTVERTVDRNGGDLLPAVPELRSIRLPEGTLLTDAGLRPGDVLTSVNDVPIDSLSTLISLWPRLQSESDIRAVVLRNGQPVTLNVHLR